MADAGIRVLGVSQAMRNMQALSQKLQVSIIRQASRATANVFLKSTKPATYGTGRTKRTGLMQRAQGVSVSKKGDKISARVRMRKVDISTNTKASRTIRASRTIKNITKGKRFAPFYWIFMEKGTKTRRNSRGANRGKVGRFPWVNPIFDSQNASALDAFRKVLNERVAEECSRLPKGKPTTK